MTQRLTFVHLLIEIVIVLSLSEARKRPKQCALFPTHYGDVLRSQEGVFIELGEMSVKEDFSVELNVLPAPFDHDGNLFAIGSKREFPYYEWRTKANQTQYLVVEIVYSSVLLTLKALGTYNLHSLEIYRTHPETYDLGDGRWHHIKATTVGIYERNFIVRNTCAMCEAWRSPGHWHLQLDDKNVTEEIIPEPESTDHTPSSSTNVWLEDMPAFLGGRPGYTDLQFRGVIKNLKVNGRRINLDEKYGQGGFGVVNCRSWQYRNFTDTMDEERKIYRKAKKEEIDYEWNDYDDSSSRSRSGMHDWDSPDDDSHVQTGVVGNIY